MFLGVGFQDGWLATAVCSRALANDFFLFNYTPVAWFVLTQVFWDVFVGVCG